MTEPKRPDEEEEEEEETKRKGNAWWAGFEYAATYGGSYRGTPPAPHGGAAYVRPEDVHGSLDLCWCGQPFDHDWPGKASGVRHPRVPREEAMTTGATEDVQRIERRSLRAYNADLADVILAAVNDYGARYRTTNNGIILFAPDGSAPYTVNARSSDRQVKATRMWFVRHCVGVDASPEEVKQASESSEVDQDTIRELAEAMNGPEHPLVDRHQTKTTESSVTEPEWHPYRMRGSKEEHPYFVINDQGDVRCTIDGWVGKAAGTGGHTRTRHMDTTNLHSAEARAKARATRAQRRGVVQEPVQEPVQESADEPDQEPAEEPAEEEPHQDMVAQITQAMTLLQQVLGLDDTQETVDSLIDENARLQERVRELEARIADFEAKQALMREALGL